MLIKNTNKTYGWVAIILHWLMAIGMLAMFALGVYMTGLDYYDSWYHQAPVLHKNIGIILFFLLVVRIIWRCANPRPDLLGQAWEKVIALAVHRMHYLLMLLIMFSGYLIPTSKGVGIEVFGWFTLPAWVQLNEQQVMWAGMLHWGAAWAMLALVFLHTVAALKHHVIDKDATLLRMFAKHEDTKRE